MYASFHAIEPAILNAISDESTVWYEPERVLERLEEYQRDLEQELADVADLIKRLKESEPQTA